jgi:phosphoglycolate phosphatase
MTRPFVIFDFDGTVADSFAESLLAYNRVAPRLRLRVVKEAEIPNLRRMGAGQLMQALGIPMWKLPRLMIAARADLHDHFHSVNPVPGIPEAIRGLHEADCHLAIVTSNSEQNVRNFLDRHGIVGFDTVIAGASIFGKATRLRRLIKTMAADRATTVYLGDTIPDIRAAHEAGTLAVAVAWGFSDPALLAAEAPDALVDSTNDLTDAIKRLLGRSFSIPARST